jgi:lipopolysaccharide/colanic/teichoic acid biosynthesis glycosyltransferase
VDTLYVDDVARAPRRANKLWYALDDAAQQFDRSRAIPVPKWKRRLDIGCIIFMLPALLLLTLFLLVFIKIVSRGPALIRQKRIGHRCQPFMCWKFRTMHMGADTSVHQRHLAEILGSNAPMTKMDAKGDSRLIPCGRLLRAMGLDELPQLINVARGEMSIVGPRPCLPYEFEKYLPWQRARFDALPGLTGLWQVSGKNNTTFTQMIRLDIAYAQQMSLRMDLKILARTFGTLAGQLKELRSA